MTMADYGAAPNLDPLMRDLAAWDLFGHVAELEAYGVTVVPPEKMRASEGFVDRLRDAILRTFETRTGARIGDWRTDPLPRVNTQGKGWDLIEEDEVFIEAATNPVVLALVRWLCGGSAVFGGQTWILKGPDGGALGLHSDSHGLPPGSGTIAHMCNASWLATDYAGVEDGPTVFVPGSHHYGRATLPHEGRLGETPFRTVPIIGKAGSLAIWNGATWHGAAPRTTPGLRLLLLFGSRARGDASERSDWDVGYIASTSLDVPHLLGRIALAVGTDRIDLVDLERASGLLRFKAAQDGVALFEQSAGDADRFRLAAATFWCDAAPLLQKEYDRVLEGLGR